MTFTTRLLIMVISNILLTTLMMLRAFQLDIDVDATLLDNFANKIFLFDFVSFLVVSFVINLLVIVAPSKKERLISRFMAEMSVASEPKNTRHKKQTA